MTDIEHYRVLLVEDNELDARSISRALTGDSACSVDRVSDLAQGIAAVREQAFDCVLLDLSLPDSDGLVSVDTMVSRSPHCPVVVLTGLDDPQIALEAVARGAQDYLVKSTMTPELVIRAIRYAVARHHAETELTGVKARLDNMHAREQIARDIHDTVIQRLFATGLTLQAATSLPARDEVADRALTAVGQIDEAIRELREAIFDLHTVDGAESFAAEVGEIAETYRSTYGIDPVVRLGTLPELEPDLRQDVLAVIRESLSNVARHAAATAVTLTVVVDDGVLVVRVSDNGAGMRTADDGGGWARNELGGNGLPNLAARAQKHHGSMRVRSERSAGTELVWTVPVELPDA